MIKALKALVILVLIISVLVIVKNLTHKELKEYISNKELQIIKAGWKGNLKIDGEFVNFESKDEQIMPTDIFKWKVLSKNPQEEEKKADNFKLELVKGNGWINSSNDMIVWLGHASFFIRLGGTTIITDPVFYDMSFIKRQVGMPCETDKVKDIDYLLLSHGHRDHFDKKTINELVKVNPDIEALVPLNNTSYFQKKGVKFQGAGWFQKYETNNDIEIYFMPARHWNRRGILDFNQTLWGSFIIKYGEMVIFFAGDTSFGEHFKEIAGMFPEINYCLLPVGAYKPENIMKDAHLSPWQAYDAFKIMGANTFIPMHFGTYDLADEPLSEPQRVIEGFEDDQIKILKVGEVLEL